MQPRGRRTNESSWRESAEGSRQRVYVGSLRSSGWRYCARRPWRLALHSCASAVLADCLLCACRRGAPPSGLCATASFATSLWPSMSNVEALGRMTAFGRSTSHRGTTATGRLVEFAPSGSGHPSVAGLAVQMNGLGFLRRTRAGHACASMGCATLGARRSCRRPATTSCQVGSMS